MVKTKIISETIKGVKRKENQDNLLIIDELEYIITFIFDGVGSALNGKKATQLCCEFITKEQKSFFYNQETFDISGLMFEVNKYLLSQKYQELLTTYCSTFILKEKSEIITYSSMGDSRIYVVTSQYFQQISIDDSPSYLPQNVITKCLGMNSLSRNDFTQNDFFISDNSVLLCTDGFYNLLENNPLEFFEVFNKRSINSIKNGIYSLIKNVNTDDSTFILIK